MNAKPCKDHGLPGNRLGYGVVRHLGKTELLHRLVLCDSLGIGIDAIKGWVVRHTCDNPRCIEPTHLIRGTQADNVRDMMDRGRHRFTPFQVRSGTDNPMSKLDYEKARAIRVAYAAGGKQKDIARQFGVSATLISYVVNNRIWNEAIGQINAAIAPLSITADGLAQLGFPHVGTDRAAKLYAESSFEGILSALAKTIARADLRREAA
jgi:hypothetical protein